MLIRCFFIGYILVIWLGIDHAVVQQTLDAYQNKLVLNSPEHNMIVYESMIEYCTKKQVGRLSIWYMLELAGYHQHIPLTIINTLGFFWFFWDLWLLIVRSIAGKN